MSEMLEMHGGNASLEEEEEVICRFESNVLNLQLDLPEHQLRRNGIEHGIVGSLFINEWSQQLLGYD